MKYSCTADGQLWQAADKVADSRTLETVTSERTRIDRADAEAVREQVRPPALQDT